MRNVSLNEKILSFLIVNYRYASGIGLMHGKMGGVLFFLLYARHTGITEYEKYAEMLMKDIYREINEVTPVSFATGLCGIGWGIEFLIQNKLIGGDSDEILADIDDKIMERSPLRIKDYSLEKGLGGILFYVNARIKSYDRKMPFDIKYLAELEMKTKTFPITNHFVNSQINDFKDIMAGHIDYKTKAILPDFLFGKIPDQVSNISDCPLGIYNGLTGFLLKDLK